MAKFYRFNTKGDLLVEKTFDELVTSSNVFPEYSRVRKGKKWGVVETESLEVLIDIKFDRLCFEASFDNSVVVLGWLNEKTYLMDINGKDLVPETYEKIYFERNTNFGVSFLNNLSGIISIENKTIFEPEYLSCKIIQHNLFLLQKENIFYLGNEKREILNNIECQEILPIFLENNNIRVLTYFIFKLNNKYGLLDIGLNIIIPSNYESIEVNKFGKIYGVVENIYFELNRSGQLLNKLEYSLRFSTFFDHIKISQDNFNYIVSKDEAYKSKRGVLDNEYNLVLPFEYDWIKYSYGVWIVTKGRSMYLLDKNFNPVTNAKFKSIGNFEEQGIACVQDENFKYKFINQKAEILENQIFDNIHSGTRSTLDYLFELGYPNRIKSGLCGVMLDSKWGYIDLKGSLVIECKFDEITEFDSRRNAKVKFNGKWGVIDAQGKSIIPFVFDNIVDYNMENELIISTFEDKFGLINFKGNTIINFEYEHLKCDNLLVYGSSKKPIAKRVPKIIALEPTNLLDIKFLEKHNNLIHNDLKRVMVMAVVSGEEDDLSNRLYIVDVIKKDNTSATFISGYAGGGVWDECTFINEKEYNGEDVGFTVFDYIRDDVYIKELVADYICEIDDELDEYQYKSLKHFVKVGDEDFKLLYSVWYNDSEDYTLISKNDKKRFKKLLKSTGGIWWKDWNFKF
jgi:hypothetical protein